MTDLQRFTVIAHFVNQHDRPRNTEVMPGGVVIYSEDYCPATKTSTVVAETVNSMAEARAVLGY